MKIAAYIVERYGRRVPFIVTGLSLFGCSSIFYAAYIRALPKNLLPYADISGALPITTSFIIQFAVGAFIGRMVFLGTSYTLRAVYVIVHPWSARWLRQSFVFLNRLTRRNQVALGTVFPLAFGAKASIGWFSGPLILLMIFSVVGFSFSLKFILFRPSYFVKLSYFFNPLCLPEGISERRAVDYWSALVVISALYLSFNLGLFASLHRYSIGAVCVVSEKGSALGHTMLTTSSGVIFLSVHDSDISYWDSFFPPEFGMFMPYSSLYEVRSTDDGSCSNPTATIGSALSS